MSGHIVIVRKAGTGQELRFAVAEPGNADAFAAVTKIEGIAKDDIVEMGERLSDADLARLGIKIGEMKNVSHT